ncbi:hypothetical protein [Bradyrhizobium sp. CB2312]|uniref:hypothetical protein n=1 Tax=Bradyrhizobium sp. CB2312 TaxID=3039155 RepID=UPI0024B05526|nr:hypothetical protein [Bradyrhizobium sp. CB2312]WFU76610.1 hypothetical protein QA642_22680 [Bradyrhizobium sp. CB2312]
MPQLIEFEGRPHEFPDDFTQADIQRALSSLSRAPLLRDMSSSDRHLPMLSDRGSVPAPQPIPPLPPGYSLDPPAALPPLPPGFTLDRKPTLVPVDHDPWAQFPDAKPPFDPTQPFQVVGEKPKFDPAQPFEAVPPAANARPNPFDRFDTPQLAQPRLVPVDRDPFAAQPPRTGMFDDLIPPAPAAPALGATNAAANGRLYVTPEPPKPVERPASILPSSVGGAVRDFTVGAQGVGKGLTDIVTGPFDLAAGAQNLVTGGINKLFGTNIAPAIPASKLVEKATSVLPGIDPATMSPSEKLAYDVDRFGAQLRRTCVKSHARKGEAGGLAKEAPCSLIFRPLEVERALSLPHDRNSGVPARLSSKGRMSWLV